MKRQPSQPAQRYSITFWRDGDGYVGYADAYPEYSTQGDTLEELKSNIRDLVLDIEDGAAARRMP